MSDDVIDLDAARKAAIAIDEPQRVLKRRRASAARPHCFHRHFIVSMYEAEVECADCKAPLDAWTVLRELATRHENTWTELAIARRQVADLRADIAMLKAERAKLGKWRPKGDDRYSLEPTAERRWRVHAGSRVSPWLTEVDAQRLAKKLNGRVEEVSAS